MAEELLSHSNGVHKTGSSNGYPAKPVAETLTNGFFTVDRKWIVQYWNKAAEKLLGVQEKDIIGKNLWERFAGSLPLEFYTVYHKAFLQDNPLHFEEYWGEMGAWFDVIIYHCDDTLSVSFKNSNHPNSEYPENAVQRLKVLTELYRFVTEVTHDCLWEWDLQSGELFWIDGGHKRIFGYQVENALIPQSFWESRLHTDDKERVLSRLNKIITEETGSVWEEDYRFQKADGDYAYVHVCGHIIYDGKKACRMIGATQDITARRSAEMQLLESERKLSLITRQTLDAVIITDASESIVWVNSAFTRITEYGPEEVIGRKPGSFLQGKETDPSTVQYLRQRIKDKQPFDCEIINYSKSGLMYWMRIQGQPLLDENGNCDRYFAIETDITERVLLENKLVQERLNRQKEITDAALTAQENERADIGKKLHDNLNQVLGAAKLYIEMARTNDEKRDIYLEKSSGYIMNVMDEIRRISKTLIPLGMGMHVMGLFNSIKALLDDLAMINPIKIDFHGDSIKEEELNEKLQLNIFRIVQEQVNNILKHANATRAAIHLSRQENQVILLISDNGKGCDISKDRKGVGIINIKSRAELYHGSVMISSKLGEGYKLKVVLLLNDPV